MWETPRPRRAWVSALLLAALACSIWACRGAQPPASAKQSPRARALKLLRDGEAREAVKVLEAGRKHGNPDDALLLGEAALRCGQYAKARIAFREVLAARPDDLAASLRLARIDFLEARYQDALKQLNWILARSPEDREARALRSRIRLRLEDLEGAAADARRWSELAPSDPEPLTILGSVMMRQGSAAEAIALLRRAVELDPGHLESRLELARAYQGNGQKRQAEETFREAGRLEREQRRQARDRAEASYHRIHALDLLDKGKPQEALKSFADALSHDPTDPDLLREAAEAALAAKDPQEAKQYLDRAVKIAPSRAGLRRARGETLLALGENEAAILELLEAARIDPADPAPHHLLAQAYDALHRPEAEHERATAEALEREGRLPPAEEDLP
ncbi:MAG TPA: tetratricopeptide repeat protein [Candidatus Polarisedimenticolia bacterium]|nr:tetratricopeptide repeat protein [Candidatus Polarisedimenticolia bacterium]